MRAFYLEKQVAGKTLKTPQEFEFLRLNYRYLSKSAMSDELGCSVHAIEVAARAIGIDLEDVDERAQEITREFEFIPLGTEISEWTGGTTLRSQCATPGITTITRHFSAA